MALFDSGGTGKVKKIIAGDDLFKYYTGNLLESWAGYTFNLCFSFNVDQGEF